MSYKKRIQYEWSISIYQGNSPDQMKPLQDVEIPTITAKDVTDVDAGFVADPFMTFYEGKWYLFYEVWNAENGLGEIGCSMSEDLHQWTFQGMVMQESFHLSYPMVFQHQGEHYMVPETRQAGEIRLFKATSFPLVWQQVAVLATGDYADATPFQYKGHWWMYALHGVSTLHLYYADHLTGPWELHPKSPLIEENLRTSRPAGRVIQQDGKLYRLAQDGVPLYGSRVRMLEVTKLTATEYQEKEIESSPILKGSRSGWNSLAMHHMDAHQKADGTWIACVDGATPKFHFADQDRAEIQAVAVEQPTSTERSFSAACKAKICFVAGEFYPTIGGLSKSATRVATLLANDGYEVHVVVPTTGVPSVVLPQPDVFMGMPLYHIPIGEELREGGGIALTAAVWQLDQKLQFDLFHGFFLPMAYVCLMALRRMERPLMVSLRGTDAAIWSQPDKRHLTHKILEQTKAVTSVNPALLHRVLKGAHYTGSTRIIKNSIPANKGKSWSLYATNRGVVGTIGKFQFKKQIPLLVEAYAQIPQKRRKALHITGSYIDRGLEEQVKETIQQRGLVEEVLLKGVIGAAEVPQQLLGLHCFVLTSSAEGFPNAVLEAAALGLPLVVTAFPGVLEYLSHGKNALLVPVNDSSAIAEAITSILENDALAIKLSQGALQLAADLSPENEAQQWLQLHEELLEAVQQPA